MSRKVIDHIVFFDRGVLIDEPAKNPVPLMPALLSGLEGLTRIAVCEDQDSFDRVNQEYAGLLETCTFVSVHEGTEKPPAKPHSTATAQKAAGQTAAGYETRLRAIIEAIGFPIESSIIVDANSMRAMVAVDLGLYVGIFVDAPRLNRDLGLWGIVELSHSLEENRRLLKAAEPLDESKK
ncbi:MAG: hypothetical protein K9L68_11865 [Spirochaetales bacterium]|nr:hypothetical protein [Spirochaetales bacterium]MCF7939286.1 hypothetical protein [Spirochaetales bacterium]